jgi:hypothetical protein
MSGANRRAFARYPMGQPAELYWDELVVPAVIRDISIGGAAIEVARPGRGDDFLLLALPGEEVPPLYMHVVEVRPAALGATIRARFEKLDRDEAAFLAELIEQWLSEFERSRVLSRLRAQKSA